MRINLKLFLFTVLGSSLLISFSLVTRCRNQNGVFEGESQAAMTSPEGGSRGQRSCLQDTSAQCPNVSCGPCLGPIDVNINDGDAIVSGRREGKEVYIPFSFVKKYFDIYGKYGNSEETEFRWSHSYSRIYRPTVPYSSDGPFMSFDSYKVEARDRVKCISAIEGVPISIQWGPQGYFYPIQIAQYGLSHYSKQLKRSKDEEEEDESERPKRRGFDWLRDNDVTRQMETIEDAEDRGHLAKWAMPRDEAKVTRIMDAELETNVFHFQTDAPFSASVQALANHDDSGITVVFLPGHSTKLTLQVDLHFSQNSSAISLTLEVKGHGTFYLHYVGGCSIPLTYTPDARHFLYGLGERANTRWIHLTRDLPIDLQKGLLMTKIHRKWASKTPRVTLTAVVLHGEGYLDNMTISESAHLPHFFASADWFVRTQDIDTGGWPIGVTRRLAGGLLTIPPGWTSAMGQGQAMSILTRAYHLTKDSAYLRAALKATKPFTERSAAGGVVAHLFGKFSWYEEYPTTPSLFVLNGFMYSLIGLYDLSQVAPRDERGASQAEELYLAGMDSLFAVLPMFDTGSGSLYDLRHLHLPGIAPNLARWDYHSTHVNQLLLMATIVKDEMKRKFLMDTAERWISYMKGKRAPHN